MRGGFWHYLEARADRRDARKLLLIERGLDGRSLAVRTFEALDAKLLIAVSIIGLFAAAYFREADSDTRKLMIGALIAGFAGAWGYYLGSSSTAARANDRADASTALAHDALKQLPKPEPDIEVQPGERVVVEGEDRRAG